MPFDQRSWYRAWGIGAICISLVSYYFLTYQTPRYDFTTLMVHFMVLSIIYLLVLKVATSETVPIFIGGGILLRLGLLLAVPELSNDFYRFIWDGRLLVNGLSPFAETPTSLMESSQFAEDAYSSSLYQNMNSPDYFTVYPPVAQWIFYLSSWLFPENMMGNLIVMRSIIILFECGSILLLIKVLKNLQMPINRVLIYAWNPLVVIELTGNLHFEAIMIFFLLLAVYCFQELRWKQSAAALGISVATKLIPLIFLPFLVIRLGWKKGIFYGLISGLVLAVCFLTIWSPDLWNGLSSSLSLYFQKFEFNASIYYLVREFGYWLKGYNVIQQAGLAMGIITLIGILFLSFRSSLNTSKTLVWILTIYLIMSTTVHPWYITPLVALAAISDYRFPIAWSVLVFYSYAGYTESGYSENLTLVLAEYLLLLVVITLDLRKEMKAVAINQS